MNNDSKLVIYQAADGAIELPVDAKLETVWASQKQIAKVCGVNVRTVNEYFGNIFDTNEVDRDSVIRKFRITGSGGKTCGEKHYNLDAIISVACVINKKRVEHNLSQFTRALNDLKLLTAKGWCY